jgi:hypothetical protein
VPELAFFPGMNLPTARKLDLLRKVLRTLNEHFELVSMGTHARSLLSQNARPLHHLAPALPARI